jgi:hypothetical protein
MSCDNGSDTLSANGSTDSPLHHFCSNKVSESGSTMVAKDKPCDSTTVLLKVGSARVFAQPFLFQSTMVLQMFPPSSAPPFLFQSPKGATMVPPMVPPFLFWLSDSSPNGSKLSPLYHFCSSTIALPMIVPMAPQIPRSTISVQVARLSHNGSDTLYDNVLIIVTC